MSKPCVKLVMTVSMNALVGQDLGSNQENRGKRQEKRKIPGSEAGSLRNDFRVAQSQFEL